MLSNCEHIIAHFVQLVNSFGQNFYKNIKKIYYEKNKIAFKPLFLLGNLRLTPHIYINEDLIFTLLYILLYYKIDRSLNKFILLYYIYYIN